MILLLNAARRFPQTARLWSEFEHHRSEAAASCGLMGATSGAKKVNPGLGSAALVGILVLSAGIQVTKKFISYQEAMGEFRTSGKNYD